MPIIHQKLLIPEGVLGLWQIREEENWFREQMRLSTEEEAQLDRIKGRRRVEWLAARQLIHGMSGRQERGPLVKDSFGKPHLHGSDWHISVSHSWDMAAAIAAPYAVGIDIQRYVDKIDRLAHRFLSPGEIEDLSGGRRLEKLHAYWCAKEALYKAYGRRELDFCQDLLVEPFEISEGAMTTVGRVTKKNYQASYNVVFQQIDEKYMLAYASIRQPSESQGKSF